MAPPNIKLLLCLKAPLTVKRDITTKVLIAINVLFFRK